MLELADRRHERCVDIWRQGPWQCSGWAGDVGREDELPTWRFGPSPRPDVIEEAPEVDERGDDRVPADLALASTLAPPAPSRKEQAERLDVGAPEILEALQLREALGEELPEAGEAAGEVADGGRLEHSLSCLEIGEHYPADLWC